MNAAFDALVMPRPTVWVAKPTKARSPSHRAGTTARRSKPVHESANAASVKRTASSSEAGMVSSASLTITKVDPHTTVIATRTPSPRAGDMRAILTRLSGRGRTPGAGAVAPRPGAPARSSVRGPPPPVTPGAARYDRRDGAGRPPHEALRQGADRLRRGRAPPRRGARPLARRPLGPGGAARRRGALGRRRVAARPLRRGAVGLRARRHRRPLPARRAGDGRHGQPPDPQALPRARRRAPPRRARGERRGRRHPRRAQAGASPRRDRGLLRRVPRTGDGALRPDLQDLRGPGPRPRPGAGHRAVRGQALNAAAGGRRRATPRLS